MHARTIATLAELEKADWFSKVGVKDTQNAIVLSSWKEAIEHCGTLEWENLCQEASNQFCERLFERSQKRFNAWNDIVDLVKPPAIALVERKIEPVVRRHSLPKVFRDTVESDILHLCMEAEYADVYPPGFYSSQAYWYVNGHFPCGWRGSFPKGTLIVY